MDTKRCAYCHKLQRADARVCSRCGQTFLPKKTRSLVRDLTNPSIPPASPHQAGHYSGLHPEDHPYQSSKIIVQRPLRPDSGSLRDVEREPEHIVLPKFEPDTDPELPRPPAMTIRAPKLAVPRPISQPPVAQPRAPKWQRFQHSRLTPVFLTVLCLLFLLASSVLAFALIGKHTLIATAAFTASPAVLRPGDTLTLSGSGFKPHNQLHFSYDTNRQLQDRRGKEVAARVDETGMFSLQQGISASWAPGQHQLYVTDPLEGISISTSITIERSSSASPQLHLAKSALTFEADASGAVSSQVLTLSNAGGGIVGWQASSDQPWLVPSAMTGAFGGSADLRVQVNRAGLTPGEYTGRLTFVQKERSTPASSVEVKMLVNSAPATLNISDTALAFAASTQQNPAEQRLILQNPGEQVLRWRSTIQTGDGSPWLALSATEGQLDPKASTMLQVRPSAAQLVPGTYQGTIRFVGDANAEVIVSFEVLPTGGIVVSPPALNFSTFSSEQPTGTTFTLLNSSGRTLDWSAGVVAVDGGTWLNVSPSSGSLAAGEQVMLTVKVALFKKAGAYQGSLLLSAQQETRRVPISCTVAVPPLQMETTALNFTASMGKNPPSRSVTFTNTGVTIVNWMVVTDSEAPAFLTITPLRGTLKPGEQVTLKVAPDIANATTSTLSTSLSIVSVNTALLLTRQSIAVNIAIQG